MVKRRRNKDKRDFILEVGIEEMPASYFECIYDSKDKIIELFQTQGLLFNDFVIYITPRRIVFHIIGLDETQQKKEEVIKGPAIKQCYDKNGKPTAALKGFLRSKGAKEKDIIEIKDDKRHCVAVKKSIGGERSEVVLKDLLPKVVKSFSFPRNMIWNESCIRFPRPIRWILSIFGGVVVNIEISGLASSSTTYGHRYISPGNISIKDTKDFFRKLRQRKIILDEDERIKIINRELLKNAARLKLDPKLFDKDLIRLISRLTENPFLICGDFKKEYLRLPADVLSTCMKKNQKIFACYNSKGMLVNKFIAVLDGKRKKLDDIRKGYENVLESRLKDAAFFINEDSKEPFEKKREKLNELIFLGKLGTVYDKTERLRQLCAYLGEHALFNDNVRLSPKEYDYLGQSASHCKNDLVTHLVYEFPELQGIAGREYLKKEGKPWEFYQPVSDHYLPKTLSDEINIKKYSNPSVGYMCALLGIVDRFDTIVGVLGTGIEMSGSEDPYAIRRASGGMVKLIRSFKVSFSLAGLFEQSYRSYENIKGLSREQFKHSVSKDDLLQKIFNIFKERVIYEAGEAPASIEGMILEAVLKSFSDDIYNVFKRYEVLKKIALHKREVFYGACKVVERTANIIRAYKKELQGDVQQDLFQDNLEREVFKAFNSSKDEISSYIKNQSYEEATIVYADTFFELLHRFFDSVLVNVDDEKIQKNRLLLMKAINEIYTRDVADLSLIQGLL